MNEQLQLALDDILNKTIYATDKTTDFVMSELPDVIGGQLLIFNFAYSLLCFLAGVALIVAASFLVYKNYKDKWRSKEMIAINIVTGTAALVAGPLLIIENMDWLKILLALKIYILEYASQLIN